MTPREPTPAPSSAAVDELALAHCILGGTHQECAQAFAIVTPEDFADRLARAIVACAKAVFDSGQKIDHATILDAAMAGGYVDDLGGAEAVLALLQRSVVRVENVEWYAERVRRAAVRRRAKAAFSDLGRSLDDESIPVEDAMASTISAISSSISAVASRPELIVEALSRLTSSGYKTTATRYVETGIRDFDAVFGGIPVGLVAVGARPGVGKTSLCLQIARHVAASAPVLFVSLEVSVDEAAISILAQESGISARRIALSNGLNVTTEEANAILAAANRLAVLRLLIIAPVRSTVGMIRALAIQQKLRPEGVGLVVVDYLQRIKPDSSKHSETREREVAEISAGLAELAKELGCPVLCPSALGRGTERESRKPRMSDLRESGMIEFDAHMVMLLHRPEVANVGNGQAAEDQADPVIIVGKHRGGPIGELPASFDGPSQTWGTIAGRFQ